MRTQILALALALPFATLASPTGASAQALSIHELGAGVAIPFVTGDDLTTRAVLTNAAGGDRRLHFDVLNGDPGEKWEIESFHCTLSARETVEIVFTSTLADASAGAFETDDLEWRKQNGAWISFECDAVEGRPQELAGDAGNDGQVLSNATRGVLWVTVQDADRNTLSENVLFADFTLLDTAAAHAASAQATAVQGGATNDGDRRYDFDGTEYAKLAAASATNFVTPAGGENFLLAFTLDGRTGAAPTVRARVLWYDDDEHVEDDALQFDCFELIPYEQIAPGLATLDSAGHMELLPVESAQQPVRPLLCYNYQDGAMRPCATSTSTFDRDPEPALDTQL
jgi:hypothetical protein